MDRPPLFINRTASGVQRSYYLERSSNARMEVMNDVGHALFLDDTERFTEIVAGFF